MQPQSKPTGSPLVEVWGDTANPRHLACAIVIGGALSLAAFAFASRILTELVRTPELARAYAMLAGLAGCVLAGFICACLFKPKRVVTEDTLSDPASDTAGAAREQALDRLAEESGGLGTMADLPAATVQELRELQLYELFAARERRAMAASKAEAAIPEAAAASAPARPNAA
ncbi:hypothetical protein EM868_11240 [Cupriavidus gilardii]|uniref:hypothetical protein n=1 Tax=Cupriavidus gilardii TaxID=82541 RepID=UPI001EE4F647|nr:hypothetical protein [Cupriavidus gilardii]MCG5262236.1 hypothetical protein [Cupriavidus gilardii]MDF9430366.1 hypothetical protein [Cupriavidus gilardii]